MSNITTIEVRDAVLPRDGEAVRRLWLDYLTWGNDEMQARHGVHPHSPREAVLQDRQAAAVSCSGVHGCLAFLKDDRCITSTGGISDARSAA